MLDSCGTSESGETPQALKALRRLTARPAESKHPGVERNGLVQKVLIQKAFYLVPTSNPVYDKQKKEEQNMTLKEWFEKGMTTQQYLDYMKVNKENTETILHKFEIPKEDEQILSSLSNQNLSVIILTEDWCGDAMINVPILLKLAEATNMHVRFLLRDENLELMDQYLTNGTSRAIPIFIFIDENGIEKAVWGPRAPEIQKMVEEARAELPDKEAEEFPEKQKAMYQRLMSYYVESPEAWTYVYNSIKKKFQ